MAAHPECAAEAVLVYTIFTNEPLAQMVQQKAVRGAAETAGPAELCWGGTVVPLTVAATARPAGDRPHR
jgi:hypothetical protein